METIDFETAINELKENDTLPSSFSIDEILYREGEVTLVYGHSDKQLTNVFVVWDARGHARSHYLERKFIPVAWGLDMEDDTIKRFLPIKLRRDKYYDLKFLKNVHR
jgi:hypothetical protein